MVAPFGAGMGALLWRAAGRPALMRARVALRKWKLDDLATTPIARSRAGAIAKIAGRVEVVNELMEAPLTADSGVASLTLVEVINKTRNGPVSTLYVRDERVSDFIVRDATGTALVRARGAHIVTVARARPAPDADRQRQWLRRWHARDHFLGIGRTLAFFESTLAPGAEVVVLGTCVERSGGGGEGPYREQEEPSITLDRVTIDW